MGKAPQTAKCMTGRRLTRCGNPSHSLLAESIQALAHLLVERV
jgi:hypothetical protein